MQKSFTEELKLDFRFDNAVKNHEKIFYVIHQAMLNDSLKFVNNRLHIKNCRRLAGPYIHDPDTMIKTKFNNLLYESILEMESKLNNVKIDYFYLVKTNGSIDVEFENSLALIYLPQTNQYILYEPSTWDPRVLLSHEYIFIMPCLQ